MESTARLISGVTDTVLEEVAELQNQLHDACYPSFFFDTSRVKIRDKGVVRNRGVYIAFGVLIAVHAASATS
ncbi:hypothetical protein MPC4_170099 [Methylocella tundrae]|uniref:Transposase n=1 Tax=Methylocella tundrae TaxID=227605 RepID=A0A8B6M407_METTU|nr:transposase [Methylocella tundrae]VTZ25966.1 hypothetical protein MPC1_2740004 [Methylocella tundrae]VTZ49568.1 hypothetical protein MPC4_170099 [Methylocella tundrae]